MPRNIIDEEIHGSSFDSVHVIFLDELKWFKLIMEL